MKHLFHLLTVLQLCSIQLTAQITITHGTYPPVMTGTDSIMVATYNSSYPTLPAVAGATWDLSAITDSATVFFINRVPDAGYTFADSEHYNLFGFGYQGNLNDSISSFAFSEQGLTVFDTGYTLFSITAVHSDSLLIDSQLAVYSQPHIIIPFPASASTVWSSVYNYDVHYRVSVAAYSYDHTPGYVRHYVSEKDSVSGWGQMRIKDFSGSPSVFLDVLQVRSRTITEDSVFLDGAPMSPLLLLPLGVTQGKEDTVYDECYYRLGEVTPLARVQFRDAAFTQPYKCTTHVQRLTQVGINELGKSEGVKIYPNPVHGNVIFIEVKEPGEWTGELLDHTGRTICRKQSIRGGRKNQITLPEGMLPGSYVLKLYRDGTVISVAGIVKY